MVSQSEGKHHSDKKLNILLSAFFCEPHKGSEAGVGWNFAKNMAKFHNVWVLTKQSNKRTIEEETAANPLEGLNFIYYEVPQSFLFDEKKMSEQSYYIVWQLKVSTLFKEICKTIEFDLIHHLTFNQYRSPSIGFFSKKPFIMGPFGGAELINPVFFQDLSFKSRLKERWRNMGLDRHLFGLLAKFKNNYKTFVFSSKQNYDNLKSHIDKGDSFLTIPAIAINQAEFSVSVNDNQNKAKPFTIIYAGNANDWKGLHFFLKSITSAFKQENNVAVKLIGIRNTEENEKVSTWITQYGLSKIVELIKFMPRDQLIKEMQQADLSVYPAFRDSGSMAVLEACALGCPVLCFDAGGQDVFPDEILFKIPVSSISYEDNVKNFSEKLQWIFKNRAEANIKGKHARDYVFENFTWEKKVADFCELYKNLLTKARN